MKIGESIRKAIDDWELGEIEASMLHACNAVDGTAMRVYPSIPGSNQRFTTLLRDNYRILGPMGMPGVNVTETRFPVKVSRPKSPDGKPDLADVVYGLHRCTHGHGEEMPQGFELIADALNGPGLTRVWIENGKIRLSDRIIFGLLAVAVFSKVNTDQVVPTTYFLTIGTHKLPIMEWWGRAEDFLAIADTYKMPQVKLDFGDWMDSY